MPSFLDRLFHGKTAHQGAVSPASAPSTLPVVEKAEYDVAGRALPEISPTGLDSHLETPQLAIGVAQSVGIQRDSNEDSLFTFNTNLISNRRTISFGLFIVADGMGGHDNGELASSIAVEKLSARVLGDFYLPLLNKAGSQLDTSVQEVLQSGMMDAHLAIKEAAFGSGTTLTAALILGDNLTIAHVGDSRAYTLATGGKLQLLTHDHSLVKRLEEIGQISPAEASTHPKRNLLYKALGQGDPLEADISSFQIRPGHDLLICTDGLWGVIPETEIEKALQSSSAPQNTCQSLVDSANSAGGPDNISVILVRIPG